MRNARAGIAAWLGLLIVGSTALGQTQVPSLKNPEDPQELAHGSFTPRVVGWNDLEGEFAGLPSKGDRQIVSWETVYARALVRARTDRDPLEKASIRPLSPKTLRGSAWPISHGSAVNSWRAARFMIPHRRCSMYSPGVV